MSYASFAPPGALSSELRTPWLRSAGQVAALLARGLSFAAALYLCVAWPGLID